MHLQASLWASWKALHPKAREVVYMILAVALHTETEKNLITGKIPLFWANLEQMEMNYSKIKYKVKNEREDEGI